MRSQLLQTYTGNEDPGESSPEGNEVLLIAPGGGWDDHATMFRNDGKPTWRQILKVSAITRQHVDPLKWIMAQPDAAVQYKLLMQSYRIRGIDRPCVRSWIRVSKDDVRRITEMKKLGLTRKDIAVILGRCEGTIWSVLERQSLTMSWEAYNKSRASKRGNLNAQGRHGRLTQEEIDEIKALRIRGYSLRDIAGKLDRALSSIRYYTDKLKKKVCSAEGNWLAFGE